MVASFVGIAGDAPQHVYLGKSVPSFACLSRLLSLVHCRTVPDGKCGPAREQGFCLRPERALAALPHVCTEAVQKMNTTSPSLLERLRRPGDEEAWPRFVQLYTPLLHHWARRLGLPDQDTADLVQEVLTRLVQQLPHFTYDHRRRFRGWLWTITLNVWRLQRRRRQAIPKTLDVNDVSEAVVPDGVEELTEAEYRQYLTGRALRLMQAEFQPTTWKAFWACVAVGRPAADVGAELGLSVAAVYAAKSRVLRRLREELDGLLD